MRVPDTGTKRAVHSTPAQQYEHSQQRSTFDVGYKPTFNQSFNSPQQKSPCTQRKFSEPSPISAFDEKFNNKQQTIMVKSDHSDLQQKDVKAKSNPPAMLALNIPVTDDDVPVEEYTANGECKKLEDLMENLIVSSKELKVEQKGSEENTKIHSKDNGCSKKSDSFIDSFQKLAISGIKIRKPPQRVENKNDEKGELIERGPVSSSKKLPLPSTHPYAEQGSVLRVSGTHILQSGRMVAEQPYVNSCESHVSTIPQTVQQLSNNETINVTKETEEIITSEIMNENFKSFVSDWLSRQIEQSDDNITDTSTIYLQPPVFSELTHRNTSPHCSRDSAYNTLSPDSNVVSPVSYVSPMSSPVYNSNYFPQQTLLNETVTSNSSCSDSNYLPNEPNTSLDLYDLIDDFLNITRNGDELLQNNRCEDFVGPDKHNVTENKTHQNCPFYAGPSQTNYVVSQVLQVANDKEMQEMPHNDSVTTNTMQAVSHKLLQETHCYNSVAPNVLQVVNSKLLTEVYHANTSAPGIDVRSPRDQPPNVPYTVTVNQFNYTVPKIMTTIPPKHLLMNLTPKSHIQPNLISQPTVYIPTKSSNQIPLNIPVVSDDSQFIYRHKVLPVMEANVYARKPDNSVNSFIYGDNTKKNLSESVPLNPTRFSVPVRPIERQILPAGSEVYESRMSVPAAIRLKNLMKNMDFTVQYVKVCHDLVNRSDRLEERLFQLLADTPKEKNWLTCVCAHIALAVSDQAKAIVLTARNNKGNSLLYLACVNHPDHPVVARYIADSLLDLKISPDEVYDAHGNSLLHLLASHGDSHVFVLAELLNVRHPLTGQSVFNVNRHNESNLETPLHTAVSRHSLPNINCLSTVKVLITHGANVAAQDKNAMTPLHYAAQGNCELKILTLLLQSPTSHAALDLTDSRNNSALHLAAANNNISFIKQKSLISSLIGHGADYRMYNMDGKVPLALVNIERHKEIKKLFYKK